ncbi:MAG: cysteine synthase [Thermosediminibacterales bacterium]|nr:cysteine synthase [Thermosediminibacterales bacterium]
MWLAQSVSDLIGKTPIIKLNRLVKADDADVYVKLESFNPGGSVKDRVALNMIIEAEKQGKLKPGATILEPTSGNTGIGLAMVGASRGYRVVLVMPETMSIERRKLLKYFGAELVLTPGEKGMKGALDKVKEIIKENPDYFVPNQFDNPANPEAHRRTTAYEIIEQMKGEIDVFVAGVGTGGTLTGVGEVLKKEIPSVKIIAVEPAASPVLSGGQPGAHNIQGIGAGFIPDVLNTEIIDEIIKIKDTDAIKTAQKMACKEGLLVGISSGAAIFAALKVANELGKGKNVVVIAPDTGERYLSTKLFELEG